MLKVDPIGGSLQEEDIGKTDPRWRCTRVTELEDIAKAGYWAWKTWSWIAEL